MMSFARRGLAVASCVVRARPVGVSESTVRTQVDIANHVGPGRDAHDPSESVLREATTKIGAHAVSGIRQNVAEGDALFEEAGDLVEGDLPRRPENDGLGEAALATTSLGPAPTP